MGEEPKEESSPAATAAAAAAAADAAPWWEAGVGQYRHLGERERDKTGVREEMFYHYWRFEPFCSVLIKLGRAVAWRSIQQAFIVT